MKYKDIEILIIPDIHGRDYWFNPVNDVLTNTDAHICFLGDYLDPYLYEWEVKVSAKRISIDRLRKIINLKKQYPDRITLLIGNHDCCYCIGQDICSSRMDTVNLKEIVNLFEENWDLFQLAHQCDIAGRHFVFSHAGILKGWANQVWKDRVEGAPFDVVNELNKSWTGKDFTILNFLGDYDLYRGFGGYKYGSPVWSDIRSWINITPEETFGFNIVGHTQCEKNPVIFDTIADLDCRRTFYLDSNGDIRDFLSGEKMEKSNLKSIDDCSEIN